MENEQNYTNEELDKVTIIVNDINTQVELLALVITNLEHQINRLRQDIISRDEIIENLKKHTRKVF